MANASRLSGALVGAQSSVRGSQRFILPIDRDSCPRDLEVQCNEAAVFVAAMLYAVLWMAGEARAIRRIGWRALPGEALGRGLAALMVFLLAAWSFLIALGG